MTSEEEVDSPPPPPLLLFLLAMTLRCRFVMPGLKGKVNFISSCVTEQPFIETTNKYFQLKWVGQFNNNFW